MYISYTNNLYIWYHLFGFLVNKKIDLNIESWMRLWLMTFELLIRIIIFSWWWATCSYKKWKKGIINGIGHSSDQSALTIYMYFCIHVTADSVKLHVKKKKNLTVHVVSTWLFIGPINVHVVVNLFYLHLYTPISKTLNWEKTKSKLNKC